jgi:hypothetical protein
LSGGIVVRAGSSLESSDDEGEWPLTAPDKGIDLPSEHPNEDANSSLEILDAETGKFS